MTDEEGSFEWLQLAIKAAKLGAWTWDLTSEKIHIVRTPLYDDILGVGSVRDFTPEKMREKIHSEDVDGVWKKIQAVINGQSEEYDAEYRLRNTAGQIHWIHSWGKGFRDSNGKMIRLTGVMKDITDSKKIEQDRDQFVATLSHDLRNPLAAAKTNAELLKRFPERVDKERPDKIIRNINRADRMIQDLLDATRLRSGLRFDLVYQATDFAQELHAILEDLSLYHGHRFQSEIGGDFVGVWPSEGLRRVIENLAGNAIKYGSNDAPITITLSRNGDEITLSVHNEGKPISPEDQKRLFEPFHRTVEAQKSGKKGWGLGLTVVRGVAEALHGRIDVQSAPGAGTTFSLVFSIKENQ